MYRDNNDTIEDSFQAFLVDGANFTKIQEEYPIIEDYMVANELPIKIMPFNKALNYKGDLSNVYVHFYSPDSSFERVRRYPKRYLKLFSKCAGFIGFDYSVHLDMPLVKQKCQINDNLSYTYFFASNGRKCIPNIRYGIDDTKEEFYAAIPKNTFVAIGTNGFIKRNYQKAEWFCLIEDIIKYNNPKGIIVVGTLPEYIINYFKDKCKFYFYDSWMTENRGEYYNERSK